MKLSIIIPNYNGANTINKTITSIYESNNLNKHSFEIIVVDDFSTDQSMSDIRKNFPTVKCFRQNSKKGASGARNMGIAKSAGDLLLFIDNDAWLNKSALNEMINSLDDDTDIVFPRINFDDGAVFYPLLEIEKKYPHISVCFIIKRLSLEKLDAYFDENYRTYLEDADFFIRCKNKRLIAKFDPDARIIHADRANDADYTGRYYLEVRNTVYGMRKFGKAAKKSGLQNPFTIISLIKELGCAILNFAWFNWQAYDRQEPKIKAIFRKNRITKSRLKLLPLFVKALIDGLILKKEKSL